MGCFRTSFACLIASGCLLCCSTGCDTTSQPKSVSVASPYVLASEPADAKTPTELKESLDGAMKVVVVGRVDAGDLEPFEAGKATFVMTEMADEAHAQGDPDHANKCPFCKRKLLQSPKVVVQFVGDDGNVLAEDAQEMLGIHKGDVVVVEGTAEYQEPINMIQVNATAIFRHDES